MTVMDDLTKLNGERNEAASLIMGKDEGRQKPPQSVIFMVPSYSGSVTMGFLRSFYESAVLLAQAKIEVNFQSFVGDPYLSKSRNLLVSTCLRRYPQATDFFFLDDDLEWDATAILKLVQRPEPIVAGIYPKKNDTVEFPAAIHMAQDTRKLIEKDGLLVADLVPTGFLRVKRHVYEEMAAQSPQYKDGTGGGELCWNFFEMGFAKDPQPDGTDGNWWGEDYAWGRRAQAMGYKLYVYPDIEFGHRGPKTWRNNFVHSVNAVRDGTAQFADAPPAVASPAAVEPEAAHDPTSPIVAASMAAEYSPMDEAIEILNDKAAD